MLSVVVLTKNEAECIQRCLESVQWADEVIVVDSHSSDETCIIAERMGAKVFQHPFKDFSSQRNYALTLTKNEWVLMLDADEIVTQSLALEIKEVLEKNDKQGYEIPREDYAFNKWLKHGETGRIFLLRLAKKNQGTWVNPVHELWKIDGSVGRLKNPLLHYSHPDLTEFIEKLNRYTTADARALYEQGIRTSWWTLPTYPLAKFMVNYFGKRGFLDGVHGFVFALLMSFYSFTKRAKLWMMWYRHDNGIGREGKN